ncbi:MAG: ArnT family glycosyltransferase [Anaerolineales bacterium]
MLAKRKWLPWAAGALITALIMAALDHRGSFFAAFLGYLVIASMGAAVLALFWSQIGEAGSPRGVAVALAAAVLLRLALGTGLFFALPAMGYDTKPQNQGYVYYDAYARDTDAYARGRSDKPLWSAFEERTASDQYGGLLFISSAAYRYLSEGFHRPLMMVVLAAAVSSLAVIFTWGFGAILFGSKVGLLAAWIVALYPDYALLGASQMREAFFVPGLASALYGYARLRLGDQRQAFLFMGLGVALALLVSPPYALLALFLVGSLWLISGREERRQWLLVLLAGALLLFIGLALSVQAWSGIQGLPEGGIFGVLVSWLTEGAAFQLTQLEEGSGWVQKMFDLTPAWSHAPLATFYGLTLPFLPAALADNSGAPIWQAIAIFRSVGWYALLPALIYGTLAAFTARKQRSLLLLLALVVWSGAVLASYRAGGDLWDNPRYRTAFISLQAVLVAWAWVTARNRASPWLRRWYVTILGACAIFLHWYVGRYYGTPRLNLNLTLALTAAFVVLYLAVNWWRDSRQT